MLFSSVTFLYAFLPVVLVLYFAAPKKLKNFVLLIASLFFYYFGERTYIAIMLISSVTLLSISEQKAKKKSQNGFLSPRWLLIWGFSDSSSMPISSSET